MALSEGLSTNRQIVKSIVFVVFCRLLLPAAGTPSAQAATAVREDSRGQRAWSCASLRSMARVYMASGGYEKAQPFLERAADMAKTAETPDSEKCACRLDLAYLYKNQGKLAEAETMCKSGLELQEEIYGPNHPYVAYTLRILSDIYQGQSRYAEAAAALERAMTIMRKISGEDEQDVAPFEVDMARLLVAQGDLRKAESYFDKAIALIEKKYGPGHLYTTKVLASLAKLYAIQMRYGEAEELMSRILPVQERVYGPDHHLLVPAWLIMSEVCQAKGDLAGAETLIEKSLRAVESQADSGQLVKSDVLIRFGEFYILSKQYPQAEGALQEALEVLANSHSGRSDRATIALAHLAKVRASQGRQAEAEELCQKSLDMLESIFDDYHPNVANVLETLAGLYRDKGQTARAAELEQRIEEIRGRKRVAYVPVAPAPGGRAVE